MNDQIIFGLGFVFLCVTVAAVLLVGRSEADDPAHGRTADDFPRDEAPATRPST